MKQNIFSFLVFVFNSALNSPDSNNKENSSTSRAFPLSLPLHITSCQVSKFVGEQVREGRGGSKNCKASNAGPGTHQRSFSLFTSGMDDSFFFPIYEAHICFYLLTSCIDESFIFPIN
jgi:hypothetical protein